MNLHWNTSSVTIDSTRFPAIWLRDQDPEDRDPTTGQRLADIADLPEHPEIGTVTISHDTLEIHWVREERRSRFALDWLQSIAKSPAQETQHWAELYWSNYVAVQQNDQARMQWLAALIRDGIAFLTAVPAVENVASLLGYITETNYGRIFDVRAMAQPNNLAYTPLGLGVHTDNPYRDPVPGYQLLHCITPAPQGGESIFVDGFAVATHLREEDPGAFTALANTPVDFAFRDAETDLHARRPLIKLDDSGAVQAIHYNNRSISTARLPLDNAEAFYPAYRKFAQLLRAPEFEHRVTLRANDLVAFDNTRVLHGRTPFTGPRLLQGCYLARDGVASNFAILRRKLIP